MCVPASTLCKVDFCACSVEEHDHNSTQKRPPAAVSYSQLSNSREQFWVSRGKLLKSMEQSAVTVILEDSNCQLTIETPRQQAWAMIQTADYTIIPCTRDILWWKQLSVMTNIANICVWTRYDWRITEWRDRFQSLVSDWLDGFTHSSALSKK